MKRRCLSSQLSSSLHSSLHHGTSYFVLVAFFSMACALSVAQADEQDDKDDKQKQKIEKSLEITVEVDDDGNVKIKGFEDGEEMDLSKLPDSVQDMLKVHLHDGANKEDIEAEVHVLGEVDAKKHKEIHKALLKVLGDGKKEGQRMLFFRRGDGHEGEGIQLHTHHGGKKGDVEAELHVIAEIGDDETAKLLLKKLGADGKNEFKWFGNVEADLGKGINVWVDKSDNQEIDEFIVGRMSGGRYRLGVALEPVSPALCAHLGLNEAVGLMVSQVLDDTPAEEIGLKRFDVLVRIGDEEINAKDQSSLVKAIEAAGESGDKISVTYMRQGKRQRKRFKPQKVESVSGEDDDGDDDGDDADDDDDDDEDDEDDDDDDEDVDDEDDERDPDLAEINARIEAERVKMSQRKAERAREQAERVFEQAQRAREEGGRARERAERARAEAARAREGGRREIRVERERGGSVADLKKEIQELREAIEEIRKALSEGDD